MEESLDLKMALYNTCEDNIRSRIDDILKNLSSIKESRNNESKSSAGDKHETGRTMMQLAEEKINIRLIEAKGTQHILEKMKPIRLNHRIVLGSLVKTSRGNYYISIGIGKIQIHEDVYYCISTQSPLFLALRNKEAGETATFNGKEFYISKIC